jgi:hypothetical protein
MKFLQVLFLAAVQLTAVPLVTLLTAQTIAQTSSVAATDGGGVTIIYKSPQ